MPDDIEPGSRKQVTLIPTERIRVLNPRVRNRRTFEAMVNVDFHRDVTRFFHRELTHLEIMLGRS